MIDRVVSDSALINSALIDSALIDSTLIRAAQAGDDQAFEALFDLAYTQIFRIAYRWCGRRADAEDIAQLAAIKLAQSLGQFRFEASFSTWLYRLVINCAKDWHKSQVRHQHLELDDTQVELPSAAPESAETSIFLRQVLQLLDSLAEGFKETALLVYGEGLTHAQAAEVLSVKESTVSWRLHETRKQLQLLQQQPNSGWEPSL